MPGKRFRSNLADWDACDRPAPGSSYVNKYSFCFFGGDSKYKTEGPCCRSQIDLISYFGFTSLAQSLQNMGNDALIV